MTNNSISYRIFRIFNTILMTLIIIVMVYPYLNVIVKSFDSMTGSAFSLLPEKFSLINYKTLFKDSGIYMAFLVSVLRTACSVVLSLAVQFSCAYALSKKGLHGKAFFVWLFMIPQFINAGTMPTYVMLSKYGLLNNFWVYVLPGLCSFYNVVIIRTFIQSSIPYSIQESAIVDGANPIKIFASIILPLSKPILATIALWVMVAQWNDYTTTLLYVTNSSLFTLQYKMMEIIKESDRVQKLAILAQQSGITVQADAVKSDNLVSAQVVLTTIPIICVYPFLQKYFVKGLVVGSVKG